ncbi:hypothetical protein CRYUN_Cryun26dG0020900 [Craigia yunnanensis]
MLLTSSLSLSPEDSPSTTSPPPLQPLPVVQPPLRAPGLFPPSTPTNTASPVVSPPLLTPPLTPISTPATPPPFLPVASSPPAVIAVSPVTPSQPPTPPIFTSPPPPPPAATTISPVASPPHPPAPALVIPSPPLPTIPAPPPQPSTYLPSTSPLPSPTPPTPPSVILPPPAITVPSLPPPRPPIGPPSLTLVSPPPPAASHSIPNTPGSSQGFPLPAPPPSLQLAIGKEGLPTTKQGSHSPIGLIVACIGVGILLFVVFALVCIFCKGGFGYVHKGVLPIGEEVAVQQLKAGSQQEEREFQAEIETISRVHHKHLVSLVGYRIIGTERLLVYEFVPNKTLEFHLHGNGQPVIVWERQLKLAIGSATGIAYLHEDCNPTIIHRDIKAANILLDPRFEAKVSDFGLAKILFDASSSITHIFTRVVGTFGYLAPEYALTGKLTDKSDVYSYGVMLLELITGCPSIIKKESSINQSLVDWTRPLLARALEDFDFDALADPRLHGVYNKSEMASMVTCAAASVRQSVWLRPRLIQELT